MKILQLATVFWFIWPVLARGGDAAPVKPSLELIKGEKHFRYEGVPRFVVGRNPVAVNADAFAEHFKNAADAGESFVRIHFCYMPPDEKPGEVHPYMMKFWDAVLNSAEKNHLAVMPVLGVWADWNDGSKGEGWHNWEKNPFNAMRGGPAKSPSELFEDGACKALWLKRLESIVRHWQGRRCIVGWEIFSELDMLTGSTENKGVAFAEAAAKVIRAVDNSRRPVTSSLTVLNEWPQLFKSDAIDIVQVHPYGDVGQGDLDELILKAVRERLSIYGKPVLIGECGLNWRAPRGTLDASERAPIGLGHAIWASVVSGAMNGRMFWWQDGYDQFEGADLTRHHQKIAMTAAKFVKDLDYSGLIPLECKTSAGLRGGVLGSAENGLGEGKTIIAWFRDLRCKAPEWREQATSDQWVLLPTRNGTWLLEVVDPATGKVQVSMNSVAAEGTLRVNLAEFRMSVALRLKWLSK